MFYKRIKHLLKRRKESLFLAFEISHFLIGVILVAVVVMPYVATVFRSSA